LQQAYGLHLVANQTEQVKGSPTNLTIAANNPPVLLASASTGPSIVNVASGGMGQGAAAVSLNTRGDNVLFKEWTADQLGE
jgi:hypothetical protein